MRAWTRTHARSAAASAGCSPADRRASARLAAVTEAAKPGPQPWERLTRELLRLLHDDPRLAGLETAVRLEVHERGVGYSVGSSFTPTAAWMHAPEWWKPERKAHARRLHELLAGALLEVIGMREG
jgi:hypothetical protein